MNPLREVQKHGQSIWLDYMRRDLITSGELGRLIEEDGVSGITSNPTIFQKAISESSDYDASIRRMMQASSESVQLVSAVLFEQLEIEDIRMAADALRPVYEQANGDDGFVSIEVNPHLAYDTPASVAEAKRLWEEVDRPNLMVKIPATCEGLPVIEQLTAEGVNVNVTLIFSVSQYDEVANAYLQGLKRLDEPRRVTSVASFFVSRVDTAVDEALDEIGTAEASALRGQAAIANAQLAYFRFHEIFHGEDFKILKAKGARVQKPLWASTGTKNKNYSDVKYVEGLIGAETINSVPPETLAAFREHGRANVTLPERPVDAEEIAGRLLAMNVNLRSIGMELTEEGVEKFEKSYDDLIHLLAEKQRSFASTRAA